MSKETLDVCVPEEFTDQEIIDFAEDITDKSGWKLRSETGEEPERSSCAAYDGFVHVTLFH